MQGPTTRLTKERRKGQGGRLPAEKKGGARQARGIMLAGRGNDVLMYTTTGHGGDGVGFFYQKEFSLYTRAPGAEAWGCVSFVMECYWSG